MASIVAFHVEDESLARIEVPSSKIVVEGDKRDGFHSLGESAGHLCYAYQNRCCLWTWVLQDQHCGGSGAEWIVRHRVVIHCPWNLFFHPGDLDVMLVVIAGTLYFFGLKTSKLHVVGELIGYSPDWHPLIYPFLFPAHVKPSSPLHTFSCSPFLNIIIVVLIMYMVWIVLNS